MKPIFLTLEDGAVFEGRSVGEALECAGLLSFYTGVVGYQEVITNPSNFGKIVLFTYPLIGNAGVNSEDAESSAPKVAGIITKEYPPYYSNFRAEGSLADYLASAGTVFGQGFDTRAVLLHLREHGEMKAVISAHKLSSNEVAKQVADIPKPDYQPENKPLTCENPKVNAAVLDLGVSRTFFKQLVALGVQGGLNPNDSEIVIISDAPYYLVEDSDLISQVAGWIGKKPVIGFGQGAAIVARACEGHIEWLGFGHHGVNIPVRYTGGGRNEITVQNHNYDIKPGNGIEAIFENLHDGTCEGFRNTSAKAAGANFVPTQQWFDEMLRIVEY